MKVRYSRHARERMALRGIFEDHVVQVILNHHSSWNTREGSVQYIGRTDSGRDLKVWLVAPGYLTSAEWVTVKSAAWKDEEDPS